MACCSSQNDGQSTSKKYKCDWLFVKRFWQLWKIMFDKLKSASSMLFFLLLIVALTEQFIIYYVGLIPSQYYGVLGEKDEEGFRQLVPRSLFLIIAVATARSANQYLCDVLYIFWRQNITCWLHNKYFRKFTYYQLNVILQDNVDNVDQRITQDVDRLCRQFSQCIAVLLISPFTIGYYTYKCYESTGWYGPVFIYAYFILGTIINKFIMSPVVNLTFKQEKNEGIFRFKHMHIRVNSEAIAFYRAEQVEAEKTNRKFHKLLNVQQSLVNWDLWLNFSVNMFNYVGSILSYLIISIPIFMGIYDHLSPTELSSLISAVSFVSMYLIYCFTSLINLSSKVSDIAGFAHRIGELKEQLEILEKDTKDESSAGNDDAPFKDNSPLVAAAVINEDIDTEREEEEGYRELKERLKDSKLFKLNAVSYCPPNGETMLVRDLSIEIAQGEDILINGNTGSGKTSLLRVLHGLWTPVSGDVERFLTLGPKSVLYLPQKPYLTDGTLREQIYYPDRVNRIRKGGREPTMEARLQHYLGVVGLSPLCERVGGLDGGVDMNWLDELSPGEMQRISFARLFYHKPTLAILDEATSALSQETEELLYKECKDLDMTLVSIGHRHSVRKFHSTLLRLDDLNLKQAVDSLMDEEGIEDSALRALGEKMSTLIPLSKSENTSRKYRRYFSRWTAFIKDKKGQALPASSIHVALFLTHLLDTGCSYNSISSFVYAIKWAHNLSAHPDPTVHPFVVNMLETSKRMSNKPRKKKDILSAEHLKELCMKYVDSKDILVLRDLTMILFSFAAFLRFDDTYHYVSHWGHSHRHSLYISFVLLICFNLRFHGTVVRSNTTPRTRSCISKWTTGFRDFFPNLYVKVLTSVFPGWHDRVLTGLLCTMHSKKTYCYFNFC
ncbi:lysosomal cobalamin transporter ABCD4-like [Glandiceps talaboti]